MANTKNGVKPTVQSGAMTLVLLVKKYRSQMVALLLKNGVVVPQGASDQDVALLMVNLLKVSKSFANDLNAFLSNPKVIETIAGGMAQTAQYFRMSGRGYMNAGGMFESQDVPTDIGYESQYGLDFGTSSSSSSSSTTTTTPADSGTTSGSGSSWWSGIKANLGNYLSDGIKLIGTISTNNANVQIANAQSNIAQAQAGSGGGVSGGSTSGASGGKTPTNAGGMSTTTIVLLSLAGVAVLGTVIYLATRPSK